MKKTTFQLICIGAFILIMFVLVTMLTSCHLDDDFDLKPGTFKMFSPISVGGDVLDDEFWRLTDDSLIITRDSEVVYKDRVVWHGKRLDLFPFQYNPYYPESMSGGSIVTVHWGFYYNVEGLPKFTLQRES